MTTHVDAPGVEQALTGPARPPTGPVPVCAGHDQTVRWRPGERLEQLFEERCDSLRAAGQGDRLAVDAGDLTLTFDQLDARANRLARRLLAAGARPGDRIGLLFDEGVHAYAGMLAVLKVHAAYVPLDPGFPSDRLAWIVQDAEVGLVLSQAHLRDHLADVPAAVLCVDEADPRAADPDGRRLTTDETGEPVDELCYVIYTSGSTGRPKGVAIEHAGICNFVRVAVEAYGLKPSDRVYQGMTIAFDFSVEEIWVPLLAGATLVPKPGGTSLLGRELEEFLRARAVTALCCVPTLLATLEEDLPDLGFLLVSGEACPPDLIARWHCPGRRFLNVYGPTEATVTATWTPVDPARPVTIGVPLPTYSVVILDPAEDRALPFGELGEIGIAGIGLARGYVHRDDLTERAFIRDFLGIGNNPSGRIYRTGDLGRVNDQGEIEYHGRIDTQVKIRGYRIELAEIEAVLRQVPQIAEAVVDTHEPEPGQLELVAWYSPRAGATVDARQALERLREHLPGYMVPAYLEELAVIPRLPSDKVDRKRLPPPTGRRSLAAERDLVAPATGTEQALAEVLAEVVRLDRVSVDSHFFADLGANSLLLARFCARARQRAGLPSLSMREVYLHPTVRGLAAAVGDAEPPAPADGPAVAAGSTRWYLPCGALQLLAGLGSIWLGALILVGGFRWLFANTGWVDLYLRSLAFTVASFLVFSALPVAAKWLLIGRWQRQDFPVWSLAYVRFWFVKSLLRANPMRLFVGSPLYCWYLRALGARVGRRVAIFSGSMPVCTDLLTIGDGTVIRKDCSFSGYRAHAGRIQTGAVTLGRDVLVGEMTVLDIEASMGDGASLGHASSLHPFQVVPPGQSWHGSPAQPADADYRTLAPARCGTLRRVGYSTLQLLNRLVLAGPLGLALAVAILPELPLLDDALGAASLPLAAPSFYRDVGGLTFALFFGAVLGGLAAVTTLPRVVNLVLTPDRVYPLYGFHFWAQRTVARMTNLRFFTFLFGDSSAIVHYLKAIGYDLSRIEQTGSNFGMAVKHETPFLSGVGTGTMVSDGLSLINADFSSSSFRVSRAQVGPRNFLGNNIAFPAGGRTGDNCLLATKVMVPVGGEVREGTGLLGSPPFEIPRSVERDAAFDELKQGDQLGRRLAAKNRHNAVTIAAYLLVRWLYLYGAALVSLPAVDLMGRFGPPVVAAAVCLLTLYSVGYFVLVERLLIWFRPLVPRFCSIYDLAFWEHERYWKVPAMAYVQAFNGTPFKNLIWRLLGVRLGRRVFDDGCWMTERTLVAVGDDCTLNTLSTLQSHSLEDGTFKSDHITIGAGCTVGINAFVHYGVTMGDGAVLEADAFLMKGEELAPGARWRGNPASGPPDRSPEPAFPHGAGGARVGWEAGLPAGLAALPVATASPYGVVGVAPSIYLARDPAPPYAPRDADEPLDRALAERRFVLVVGDPGAGTSRTAFEAVRRRFPASRLLVPAGGATRGAAAVAELLRHPPPATTAPPAVLWLDGLDRFLGHAALLDAELLGWLRRPDPGLVVVATIDARRHGDLRRARGGIGWAARRVLELATEVRLPARLSPAERAEARRRYPEVDLDRGLGEALGAAGALELRHDLGTVAAPVGRALVQAAVDWRRTGITAPITEADLRLLCRAYLRGVDPPGGRRAEAEGLAWACQPVAPGIALLRRAGRSWPRRFLAADHLVALADGTAGDPAREVDPAAWALATARATPEDAARIGFVAHVTGNLEAAAAAWSRASASRHPRVAPWAAVALGLLRRRLGDLEGAAAAFEEAIGSGHTDAARRAHTNLRFLPLLPTRPVTDRPLEVLAGDR